jgi:Fic family protein
MPSWRREPRGSRFLRFLNPGKALQRRPASIHPFLHYVPFSSLERVVEESKDDYYRALRRAQSTLDGDESNLIVWLDYFLECLVRQKDALDRMLGQERRATPLAPLSEKLLALVRERGRVTVQEAARLTGANRNTIKDHLRRLVNAGHLARQGRARGTWYERP